MSRPLLALALLSAPALAEPTAEAGRPVGVTATKTEVTGTFGGAALLGAWALTADDPAFGGLSGAILLGERLIALGDRGIWLTAAYHPDGPGPLLAEARVGALRGGGGSVLEGEMADAEALGTACDDALAVAFERRHRVVRYDMAGRLRASEALPDDAGLENNAGIEALATDPADCARLVAVAESAGEDGYPVLVLGPGGIRARGALAAFENLDVTAADIGADGRLYVLHRAFSPLTGLDVALRAYALDDALMPVAEGAETLARFGPDSGIDNMEAIAAWTDAEGRQRLMALSDDNFNPLQRTLLLDLLAE